MDLLACIDHTLLKVNAKTSRESFLAGARLVLENGLRAFVVPPNLVSPVTVEFPQLRVATVVSYPLGGDTTEIKRAAILQAARDGAHEVDIVLNLASLVAGTDEYLEEAAELCDSAGEAGVHAKLIIETPILSEKRMREVCAALKPLKFYALKTSTGYGREPTCVEDVRALRECLGESHRLKASGGIGSLHRAREFLDAGADILGASRSAGIISELQAEWY
jgi:deoxyribose-phosphate aldolase